MVLVCATWIGIICSGRLGCLGLCLEDIYEGGPNRTIGSVTVLVIEPHKLGVGLLEHLALGNSMASRVSSIGTP